MVKQHNTRDRNGTEPCQSKYFYVIIIISLYLSTAGHRPRLMRDIAPCHQPTAILSAIQHVPVLLFHLSEGHPTLRLLSHSRVAK